MTMDCERLFVFCCGVRESPVDAPIYADYLEDLGENRELAFVVGSCVTMAEWMKDGPGFVLLSPIRDFFPPDREPYGRGPGRVWSNWTTAFTDPGRVDRSELPEIILRYLSLGEPANNMGKTCYLHAYEDITQASQDLSQACIRWALDKARQTYLNMDMVC
jgi:hypothetical protein